MNSLEALQQLGVTAESITKEQRECLDRDGYFVIKEAFSENECQRMAAEVDRIVAEEGDRAGSEVSLESGATRISNVFNKTDAFDSLLNIKPMLAAAYYLLGDFKVHGANMREPHTGYGRQPLHSDSVKLPDGRWCLVNSLITFDPMTLENGPTRIVPGSHKWAPLNVPGENAMGMGAAPRTAPHKWATEGADVTAHSAVSPVTGNEEKMPVDPFAPYQGEIKVTVPARSVVVCNAHMWHSGTTKNSSARRRQLHLSHTRRDMPQQLNQRAYLTRALFERMTEVDRYFLDIT